MNTSGWSLLALTTKQPPMSSTVHGGGKRQRADIQQCLTDPASGGVICLGDGFLPLRPRRYNS
jgi:hypothetical protein